MQTKNILGVRIRMALAEKQWTQEMLAKKVPITATNLGKIISGGTDPQLSTLRKIADLLGKSVGWMLGENESTKPSSGASAQPSSQLDISESLRLPEEELRMFLKWLLTQVKTMPKERPLTIACRKIATRLADENAPLPSQEKSAQSHSAKGASGKDAASAKAPAQQESRQQ